MSRRRAWMTLVFPVVGLSFLVAAPARPGTAVVTAQEPELTPQAYLPLILNNYPPLWPDLDYCEPNGAPSLACPIEPGTYTAHVSSPYDQDWYIFTLDGEGDVSIRLGVPGDDNYDLYLYGDPPGVPIAWSVTPGNAEEVIEATLSAGSYYVLVFPAQQESELPYTLTLEVN